MRVNGPDGFPRAGGREVLSARTRHVGGAEERGERLAFLGPYDDR
jgi:hypothetical protein